MAVVVLGNKVPLSEQVANTIRQRLRMGQYSSGQSLPSVRAFSNEFGVSLNVIQRAIRNLEKSGLLVTHPGKGIQIKERIASERAAIMFGLIEPFGTGMAFEQQILQCAGRIFSERDNLLIVRSSDSDLAKEREVAEHLIHNGARGLMLWPMENNSNGQYFQELSRKIPVVQVDRLMDKSDIPAVVHEDYRAGRDICSYMLETLGKKNMVALVDNLQISPYQNMIRGFHDQACQMGRMSDLTIIQLPISDFIKQLNHADFSQVDQYAEYVECLFRDQGYEALFCSQDEFIDYAIIETGVYEKFPEVQLGTTTSTGVNICSRKYNESGVLEWVIDHSKVISTAAGMLQKWVLSRKKPIGVTKIPLVLKNPIGNEAITSHELL